MKKLLIIMSVFMCSFSSIYGVVIQVPKLTEEDMTLLESFVDPPAKTFYDSPLKGCFNTEFTYCKTALALKKRYNLSMAIETGSFEGKTTLFFSKTFDTVHSFELNPTYIKLRNKQFKNVDHVHIHPENSGRKLGSLLKTLNKDERILFYLDAHWNSYWPLRDEITQITKYFKDNCIILIDDAKIPGMDIPYDCYGTHECSIEYVKSEVDKLFSGYKVYHLYTERKFRGKILLIPDAWGDEEELTVEDFK